MSSILIATLVPAIGESLSDAAIRPAAQALSRFGAVSIDGRIIDGGAAIDLVFSLDGVSLRLLRDALERSLAQRIDVIVQPQAIRTKRLLICDMDSTMIGQECIDELADYAGVKPQVAEITERAMRGELEFDSALRERVALLKGVPVSVVDTVLTERITLNPGGEALVRTMRAAGAVTALVSGGFTLFTGPLSARIGFAINRANVLEAEHGQLTGTVRAPILGQEAKRRTLIELAAGGILWSCPWRSAMERMTLQ